VVAARIAARGPEGTITVPPEMLRYLGHQLPSAFTRVWTE
jgi:hypothetical protein